MQNMPQVNEKETNHLTSLMSPDEINKLISKSIPPEARKLASELGIIQATTTHNAMECFKTQNPTCIKLKQNAIKLSVLKEPVLITGESGTGKELIAKILHGTRTGEFVAVNINAITDTLFEAELFGSKKGSYTGADRDRKGLIEQATGGTLFIDEIGDLHNMQQVKLLRLLQESTYRQVGSSSESIAECRFVFATHRDLLRLIEKGTFRRDLYERLSCFKLKILPLRERAGDLELFNLPPELTNMIQQTKPASQEKVGAKVQRLLSGNVRQLLNLKRQVETLGIESITEEDLL